MYSDRFSLAFVAGVLMAAAERRRPGLGAWSPAVREQLQQLFRDELASVKRSFFELFQDAEYWARLEKAVMGDVFPRYAAIAERQTALEQREYGVWRGGDLLARLAYAGVGLVVGGLMVKLPFIPIPQTWDFFAFLTMIGAPLIPDLQVGWHQRRYRKSIEAIMQEMAAAQQAQQIYEPLAAANLESHATPVVPVSSGDAGSAERTRERGGN